MEEQQSIVRLVCCVPDCPRPPQLTCYGFPHNDVKQKEEWLQRINSNQNGYILRILPDHGKNAAGVCSLHFRSCDYTYIMNNEVTSTRELSPTAVPSVFPWSESWKNKLRFQLENVDGLGLLQTRSPSSQDPLYDDGVGSLAIGNVESLAIAEETAQDTDDGEFELTVISCCIPITKSCLENHPEVPPLIPIHCTTTIPSKKIDQSEADGRVIDLNEKNNRQLVMGNERSSGSGSRSHRNNDWDSLTLGEKVDRQAHSRAPSLDSQKEICEWKQSNDVHRSHREDGKPELRSNDDDLQVFVGNTPHSTTAVKLKELFEQIGPVQDVKITGENTDKPMLSGDYRLIIESKRRSAVVDPSGEGHSADSNNRRMDSGGREKGGQPVGPNGMRGSSNSSSGGAERNKDANSSKEDAGVDRNGMEGLTGLSNTGEKVNRSTGSDNGAVQGVGIHPRNKVAGPRKHDCPICGPKFNASLLQVIAHGRANHLNGIYYCNFKGCKRVGFPLPRDMHQHEECHRLAGSASVHPCYFCPEAFSSFQTSKDHMVLVHFGGRDYKCPFQNCIRSFDRPDNLETHMRIHTGEKPFQCDICDKRFRHQATLTKHLSDTTLDCFLAYRKKGGL